jgi:hypothetical protein
MSTARRAATVLVASSAMAVFGPGSTARAAPTGTITDVHALSNGQVVATFTANHDVVDPDGYAGWYPFAVDAPPGQPCEASQRVLRVGAARSAGPVGLRPGLGVDPGRSRAD